MGKVAATYKGPFGEFIRVTGAMGKTNPFRWSTKYTDDETDLVYYGYRYYNPSTGRWLSRDPAQEIGGLNLYCYLDNDGIGQIDALGLANLRFEVVVGKRGPTSIRAGAGQWSQPWWAGSGSYAIFANGAQSTVTLSNQRAYGLNPDDYCNTVNCDGDPAGDAGTIKVFLKDKCGGTFGVSFNYRVKLSGTGPIKIKATSWLYSGAKGEKILDYGQAIGSQGYSKTLGMGIVVQLKPNEEKQILTYVPFINFPRGLPVTTGTAEGSITGVSVTGALPNSK